MRRSVLALLLTSQAAAWRPGVSLVHRQLQPFFRRACTSCAEGEVGGDSDEAERIAREAQRRLEGMSFDQRRAAEHSLFEMDEGALLAARQGWTLIFNPGSDNEGIYSRRMGNTG